MRLGLYGGSFDPIHLGHLILAETCREACQLDRVWFVVAGSPPHKTRRLAPAEHRLEMARLAVAGNPAFEVSDRDTKGEGPHYSYALLESIAAERPGDDIFFLIGADSLADLPNWRHPERVVQLATLVVVGRPGVESADPAALAPVLSAAGASARPIVRVDSPPIGIASRDLRRQIAEGRSIRYCVPAAVGAYINAQELYR